MVTLFTMPFAIPVFAQDVQITKIHTSPTTIHVGDTFEINATIVNNSPAIIYFNGGCLSPLSATFDKNVLVNPAMGCLALFNANLKPGENTTISGPGSNKLYFANSTGTTNVNVTFSYTDENKSEKTISQLYDFDISQSAVIPEFPSLSPVILALAILMSIALISKKKYMPRFW